MGSIDPKEFGRRVRERRKDLGWSQEKLASEAGLSQTNIGWIEKGGPKDPRKQVLQLAEALNTSQEWLLTGKGQREIGPPVWSKEEIRAVLIGLPAEDQLEVRRKVTQILSEYLASKKEA